MDIENNFKLLKVTENGAERYLTYGDTVYAKLTYAGLTSDYASVSIDDEKPPQVTVVASNALTDRITASVNAKDDETGIPEEPIYDYYIAKVGEDYPEEPTVKETTESSHTFIGLVQETEYKIKVVTKDNSNNQGYGEATAKTTKVSLASGNITMTPAWIEGGIEGVKLTKSTSSTVSNYTIQYQVNSYEEAGWKDVESGTIVTDVTYGDTIYARLIDSAKNAGAHASLKIEDTTGPTVSVSSTSVKSDSITVTISASDNGSGMPSTPKYDYYFAKSSEDYPEQPNIQSSTSRTQTFSGLEDGISYKIKVVTNDKMGNAGIGTKTISTTPVAVATGNITISPVWVEGGINGVVITKGTSSTLSNYTVQYQVNGYEEDGWKDVESGTTVTDVTYGDTIYARLIDGSKNAGDYASLEIVDTEGPTVALRFATTPSSIKVTVTATDSFSGMPEVPIYDYYIAGENEEFSSTPTVQASTSNQHTFEGLTENATYKIKVVTKDKFGNIGQKEENAIAEEERELFVQIGVENYGDYVDLETNFIVKDNIALEDGTKPKTDWRIFHKDTNGTWVILADYLPYSYESTLGTGLNCYNTSTNPYNWISKTNRSDLLTRLNDSTAWNKLLPSKYIEPDQGIFVKGAIDVETYKDSWNAKGYKTMYLAGDDTNGYYVGASANPTSYNYNFSDDVDGYGNTLYYPHKDFTTRSNGYGYWLASISKHYSRLLLVRYVLRRECALPQL